MQYLESKTPTEEWQNIDPKYGDKYEVSNMGRFRSKDTKFIRKETLDKSGYVCQIIFLNGKAMPVRIHRQVAIAFIPNPENKPTVNHKNGIRSDNKVSNLEWATFAENSLHALFKKKGEKSHFSRLKEKQVVEILQMDDTVKNISEKYGLNTKTITRIKNGKIWKDVFNSTDNKKPCKLSWKINIEIANEIRKDFKSGIERKKLSIKYSLCQSQITSIINNQRWKI